MTENRKGSPAKRAGWILGSIAVVEGAWVGLNIIRSPAGFIRYCGLVPGAFGAVEGWIVAGIVTALFVWFSARLPSVRTNLLRPSLLKLLAIAVAVAAGFLEEIVFRKVLMDALQSRGWGALAQILASGLAFGLAHGIWGLFGRSLRAAIGATTATGVLGIALGVVYIVSGRSLAPCIAAHFLLNIFIEPGLMLAAVRGEMHRRSLSAST
jgi:uncharacterized protein